MNGGWLTLETRGRKKQIKPLFCILCLIFVVRSLGSQEKQSDTGNTAPYLIPQTVFVGDRARLVIPLGSAFIDAQSVILSKPEELPASKDISIHRIELEHRGGNTRLLIDFTAFAPGVLSLPALEIPGFASSFFLSSGITLPIASILEGDSMVLSGPAPPLAVLGTSILIYGATGVLFLLILLGIGLNLWGRDSFKNWGARFRQRRLIKRMGKILRGLRRDLLDNNPTEEVLTCLSLEFRAFLSVFTGMPCQSMSAGEFINLPPLIALEAEAGISETAEPQGIILSGTFLCEIFRRCDALRFSGTGILREDLLGVLDALQRFMDALYEAERKKNRRGNAGTNRLSSPNLMGGTA